jgi:hypothetical protein
MAWVKLDDQWYDHPKLLDLPLEAVGLWVIGLTYSNRYLTDGYVPKAGVSRVVAKPERQARHLVERGLWHPVEGGWQIHDYLDYQPSAEAEKDKRRKRAEAGRAGGRASAKARARPTVEPNDQATAEANRSANGQATGLNPVPSRPDPYLPSSSVATHDGPVDKPDEDERISRAIDALARRRLNDSPGVSRPEPWLAETRRNLRLEEHADHRAAQLLTDYPTITDGQLVDALAGSTTVLRFLPRRETAS